MNIFKIIVERVKNLLFVSAANQIEADFAARATEQKAELHREAAKYEAEGLHHLAKELQEKADAIDVNKPLAAILPGTGYVVGPGGELTLTASAESPRALPPATESATEKTKKKAKTG